jgi:hypothetical protein
MRNFFDHCLPCTTDTKAELRKRVKAYATTQSVIDRLKEAAEFSNLQKWLNENDGHKDITYNNYAKLALVGITEGWLCHDDRSFFSGFADFIGHSVPKDGLQHTSKRDEHFEVYRFSFLVKGYVLRGSMSFKYDKHKVSTTETYCIQDSLANEHGLAESNNKYNRSGFLFKRSENSYLLLSHRDRTPSEIQTAYLERLSEGVYQGAFSDWHGSRFYASRMHIRRIKTPLHESRIEAIKPDEVHDEIRHYLTKDLSAGSWVVLLN